MDFLKAHGHSLQHKLVHRLALFFTLLIFTTLAAGASYIFHLSEYGGVQKEALYFAISSFIIAEGALAYYIIKGVVKPLYTINKELQAVLKGSNEDLDMSYERLRDFTSALESISSTIIITSYDGVIEYVNSAFEKNTGYLKEEAIGKNSTLLQSANPDSNVYADISRTIKQGNVWTGVLKNKKKDGSVIWEKVTISPIINEAKKIDKFITVKVDINEQVELREKLEISYEKLKELDKKKDDFISIASHELRTPMSVIKGYSSMLLEGTMGKLNKKQEEFLKRIFKNINQLIALINDMLDLSKLESGKMSFDIHPVRITPCISDTVEELKTMFDGRNIHLEFHNLLEEEQLVLVDTEKLRRVLINLLGNAFKFTRQKGKVSVFLKQLKKDGDFIRISIKDTGVGIPKEKQEYIFEKFSQAGSHLEREIQGTGLGLAIVRDIIQKMGGNIEVESEEGKGTEFSFTLPLSS